MIMSPALDGLVVITLETALVRNAVKEKADDHRHALHHRSGMLQAVIFPKSTIAHPALWLQLPKMAR
jgi:hypothetical protein